MKSEKLTEKFSTLFYSKTNSFLKIGIVIATIFVKHLI